MGNLPTSRTETCIVGAPVDPNLLNEIQDAIIQLNTDVHGIHENAIDISKFAVNAVTGTLSGAPTIANDVGYIQFTSGGSTAWAALDFIPVGATIVSYTQFYNVNSSGSSVQPKLRRLNLASGAVNDVVAGSSDNTGAAVESQAMTGINHVVLSGESYRIEVGMSASGARIHGAIVTWNP